MLGNKRSTYNESGLVSTVELSSTNRHPTVNSRQSMDTRTARMEAADLVLFLLLLCLETPTTTTNASDKRTTRHNSDIELKLNMFELTEHTKFLHMQHGASRDRALKQARVFSIPAVKVCFF